MITTTRHHPPPIFAGLAFATILLAGCASVGQKDPPASAPAVSIPSALPPGPPMVANGDELEPRVPANKRVREIAAAEASTTKRFKPFDGPMKTALPGEIGATSVVPNAIPGAISAPVTAVFAERRASEALDRLAVVFSIRREKRGAVITLSSDKLVESGQWVLTSSGEYAVRELAAGLRDQDGHTIFIQGYTDSMGTAATNEALSLRRAEAVRDYLTTQGVAAASMRAEGMGAKRPVGANTTADGRAQNRRIEIVIAP